jgi:two-component system chemotaxis response regulator CheB
MALNRGPREHYFRPAIDPLFRSAAKHYRSQVIGVVLSGNMADGTHGLTAIKQAGGIAIVQDPNEAYAPMMPMSAMTRVPVDYVLPTAQIGNVITRLVMSPRETPSAGRRSVKPEKMATPEDPPQMDSIERAETFNGLPAPLTCPDCGGTLWEFTDSRLARYRCHVGHGFTEDSLAVGQNGKVEEALWSALRALEESIELKKRMAERARGRTLPVIARSLDRDIAEYEARADALRELLLGAPKLPVQPTRRTRARQDGRKKGR